MKNDINFIKQDMGELVTLATKKEDKREVQENLKRDINEFILSRFNSINCNLLEFYKSKTDVINSCYNYITSLTLKCFSNFKTTLNTTSEVYSYVLKYKDVNLQELSNLIELSYNEFIKSKKRELKTLEDIQELTLSKNVELSIYNNMIDNLQESKDTLKMYDKLQESSTIYNYIQEIKELYNTTDTKLILKAYNNALKQVKGIYRQDVKNLKEQAKNDKIRHIKNKGLIYALGGYLVYKSKHLKKIKKGL